MYSSFCDFFPDVKFYPNWSFFVVSQIYMWFIFRDSQAPKKPYPRCVVQKIPLSQMSCSKNANVPDVLLNDFE